MTPLQLTRSVRGLNRLRRVLQALTHHGFGYIVTQMNLGRFVPVWRLRHRTPRAALYDGPSGIGRRITAVCAELGPTFVKLGQMLSSRPDIIPDDVLSELQSLQDDVPPFETAVAKAQIAAEFGRPVDECYSWFGDSPIASGSIGQVYRARTLDGAEVVVKVRRPDVEEVIKLDIQVLKWFAETLEVVMPEIKVFRPKMLVAELEEMLARELDYVHEASATAKFAAAFADDPGIRIPAVHWDLSSARVLTLQVVHGVNVSRTWTSDDGTATVVDRRLVARRLANAYLKQVFELGVFHSDPHPGNILIDPPAIVGLIDFGQTGSISEELMSQLTALIYACVNRQMELVLDALADMGAVGADTRRPDLQRSLRTLLDKYYGLPLKRLDLSRILSEFSEVVRRHDIVIPKEVVLLCKALGMVAGVTAKLDPDLVLLDLLGNRLERLLKQQFSPARLGRAASATGWHLASLLREAPSQIRETLRRAASGAWRLNLRHESIDRLINELDRSSNRLAFSVVIAAIIVGSSVVVSASTELTLFDIRVQYFGIAGYLIAGVLGLGLTWAIFRSGRLH